MERTEVIERPNLMLKIRKTLRFYAVMLTQKWRDGVWAIAKPRFQRPVFIVGCSRSGTTVVYNVLGMATELASMHKESHDFWNFLHPPSEINWDSHIVTAADVSEKDREEVSRFYFRNFGRRRFIDKANQNCFRIPYLHALFPDACFVYVKRDGRDNINSLIHGWDRPDEYGTWSRNLPAKVQTDNGAYLRWCFFLFPGWRSFLKVSIEEVCAQQWIEANKAILSAKSDITRTQWVEIHYEDILRSPVETFQKIFEQLEITFSSDIKRHCDTLISNPYNAFSAPRLDKWKEENRVRIERIIPEITEIMIQMGYKI